MFGFHVIPVIESSGALEQCCVCTQTRYLHSSNGGGITIWIDRNAYRVDEPKQLAIHLCGVCATNLAAMISAQLIRVDAAINRKKI